MILDKLLEFDPAATAITSTAASTNVIDLHGTGLIPASAGRPGRDLGGGANGVQPRIIVFITTTLAAAGAATLNIQFQGAPDDLSGGIGTYVTYAETGVIAKASLTAGVLAWSCPLPRVLPAPGTPALLPRWLRLNYVVATGPFTAGALSSYIALGDEGPTYYQAGITVAN